MLPSQLQGPQPIQISMSPTSLRTMWTELGVQTAGERLLAPKHPYHLMGLGDLGACISRCPQMTEAIITPAASLPPLRPSGLLQPAKLPWTCLWNPLLAPTALSSGSKTSSLGGCQGLLATECKGDKQLYHME